jgi:acetyl esterase/lipase
VLAAPARAQQAGAPPAEPLWPDGAPGALGSGPEDRPTITAYLPDSSIAIGTAVVVFPGGGYGTLAVGHEGDAPARWLNSLGEAAFVVRYLLGPKYHHPSMLLDGQRAVRTVRARAAEWRVNPARIGVMGFSAGGHLASTVGSHFDDGDSTSVDPVARAGSRPDFMVLVYPVVTMDTSFGHLGSRENLLGPSPAPALVTLLSNERQVTERTPPTFLVHTANDAVVPVRNSVRLFEALQAAKVPAELHVFPSGPHGFGLAPDDPVLSAWPGLCERWMRGLGLLPNRAGSAEATRQPDLYPGPSVDLGHGPLKVSPDGRHLVHADGTPFFWLGDTAWELFHRLDRPEAERYLEDRRSKGFTVIQAVVLAEFDGLTVPNAYGETPLVGNDPTHPNEAYFRHVDFVVDRARQKGMYVGMLPTWGDKWNRKWGVGPEVFTPENARVYGEFLGRRYRDAPIVWILGGDRNPEDAEDRAIVAAMAEGLRAGDGGRHLITYHPQGGSSSADFFHDAAWLDLNLFQSGHGARDIANWEMTAAARAKTPAKPVIDGEPRYEDHPINWNPTNGWFTAFDVRQAAWWSLLAGAAGHTYGDHDIWQMWEPDRAPISSARTPWTIALHHPGSRQVGLARRLLTSRAFLKLAPDPAALDGDGGDGAGHQQAATASDGSYLLAYTPLGAPLRVRLERLRGPSVRATWFDPRTGAETAIGTFPATGVRSFDPPGTSPSRGNDWVLVLDAVGG